MLKILNYKLIELFDDLKFIIIFFSETGKRKDLISQKTSFIGPNYG